MAVTRGPILVLAAHPDDEVLGCGGSLLKWKDAGHPIHVAFAGMGRPSGMQAVEAKTVAERSGWEIVSQASTPDQIYDTVGVKPLATWAKSIIGEVRPFRVLTHTFNDLNADHRMIHEAVRVAIRENGVKEVLAFSVPIAGLSPFLPTVFMDIGAHWNRKLALLNLYQSELRPSPHPRSDEMLAAQSRVWGSQIGVMFAEAFEVIRMIWGQTSGTAS